MRTDFSEYPPLLRFVGVPADVDDGTGKSAAGAVEAEPGEAGLRISAPFGALRRTSEALGSCFKSRCSWFLSKQTDTAFGTGRGYSVTLPLCPIERGLVRAPRWKPGYPPKETRDQERPRLRSPKSEIPNPQSKTGRPLPLTTNRAIITPKGDASTPSTLPGTPRHRRWRLSPAYARLPPSVIGGADRGRAHGQAGTH